jgi:hypothetical protein
MAFLTYLDDPDEGSTDTENGTRGNDESAAALC